MVNIHNPLTVLLCWDNQASEKALLITLFSILLSEQQAAHICNVGRKHYWCLASMQYKIQEDHLYQP